MLRLGKSPIVSSIVIWRMLQYFLGVGGLFVLSRLLAPRDFFVLAISAFFTEVFGVFLKMGTFEYLMLHPDRKVESAYHSFGVAVSAVASFLLFVAAPVLLGWLGQADQCAAFRALTLLLPLSAAANVPQIILFRERRFVWLAKLTIITEAVGLSLAYFCARNGAGQWSLVVKLLVPAGLAWIVCRGKISPSLKLTGDFKFLIPSWRFQGNLSFVKLVFVMERGLESLLIGKFLGDTALGTFRLAQKLAYLPTENVSWVACDASYPSLVECRNDGKKLRGAFWALASRIVGTAWPLHAILYFLSGPIVSLLGPAWAGSERLIELLSVAGAAQSANVTRVILSATGDTNFLAGFYLFRFALSSTLLIVLLPRGLVAVAHGLIVGNFIVAAVMTIASLDRLRDRFGDDRVTVTV